MSDSEFDEFDSFAVDDSFLQELDAIEVKATTRAPAITSASSRPHRPPSAPSARANAEAGPSCRAAALGVRLPRPAPHPSSDDYGDVSFTAESLDQLDQVAVRPRAGTTILPSSGIARQRPLARTPSGHFMLQTHLNFRRENPYTKGKRWDRTEFAASGRRVNVGKNGKGKGKGRARDEDDDDEDEEEEEDWGDPLAPDPAPFVDTCELSRHSQADNSQTI